jgi:hypothetical protein
LSELNSIDRKNTTMAAEAGSVAASSSSSSSSTTSTAPSTTGGVPAANAVPAYAQDPTQAAYAASGIDAAQAVAFGMIHHLQSSITHQLIKLFVGETDYCVYSMNNS